MRNKLESRMELYGEAFEIHAAKETYRPFGANPGYYNPSFFWPFGNRVVVDEPLKVYLKSRIFMKKYRVIAALLAPIVVLGTLVGIVSPAAATSSDATLSSLQVAGSYREVSDIQPSFQPDKTWYSVCWAKSKCNEING